MFAEQAYLFRHALLREAAYELQPPGQRALLHKAAALLIDELYAGATPPELAEELCRHLRIARESVDAPELLQLEIKALDSAIRHATNNWHHRETVALLQRLLHIGPPESRVRVLTHIGAQLQYLGEFDKAEQAHRQALAAAEHGSTLWRGALRALGRVLFLVDKTREAEPLLRKCVDASRDEADPAIYLDGLNDLAGTLQRMARMDEAKAVYEEALQAHAKTNVDHGLGNLLSNFGTLYYELGQIEPALDYYRKALDAQRTAGNRSSEGITLANIGMVQRVLGDTAKAEQSYLKAIEVHRETGNAVHLASVYGKLANLYGQLERNEAALELYQQAITSEREHGASAGLGLLLCNLGILYNAMDRPAACEASLRESLQILGRYSNQRLLSAAEGALAQHLLDAGRIEEAEEYAQSSLDRALASQDPVGAALVRGTLAACRRKQGTLEESEAMLRASVAELQEMNDIAGVGSSRCSLAITLHLQGRKQDALNEWNTGHEALIQSNDMLSLKPLLAEWDEVRTSS